MTSSNQVYGTLNSKYHTCNSSNYMTPSALTMIASTLQSTWLSQLWIWLSQLETTSYCALGATSWSIASYCTPRVSFHLNPQSESHLSLVIRTDDLVLLSFVSCHQNISLLSSQSIISISISLVSCHQNRWSQSQSHLSLVIRTWQGRLCT